MLALLWHTVTNHFVDRRIQHIGEIILPFAGRARMQIVDDKILHPVVDGHGGDTGLNKGIQHVENRGQQLTCAALSGQLVRGLNGN